MRIIKSMIAISTFSVLVVTSVVAVPVYAERSNEKDGPKTIAQTNDDSLISTTQIVERDNKGRRVTGDVQTLRQQAKDDFSSKKTARVSRSVEAKQKSCEARATNLNKKIVNFGRNADRHLTVFDKTYDRLTAFQEKEKLDVADYEALISTANSKKEAVTAAIAALKAVSVDIDCTSTEPAESVVTVKTAVANVRVAFQEYRTSVKNILVALMTAKASAEKVDSSTNENTESTYETTTPSTNEGAN